MVGFQLPPTSTWWFVAINQFNRTNPATKNLQPPLQSQGKQAYTNRPRSVKSPEVTPVFGGGNPTCHVTCFFQPGKLRLLNRFFSKPFWTKLKLFNQIPKPKIPCRIEIWVQILFFKFILKQPTQCGWTFRKFVSVNMDPKHCDRVTRRVNLVPSHLKRKT